MDDDPDVQNVCSKEEKKFTGMRTVSNFNFFPIHKWVVEQLKKKVLYLFSNYDEVDDPADQ